MRDRGTFFAPVRDWEREALARDGWSVEFGVPRQAMIVSGDVEAFLGRRDLRPLGPRDATSSGTYALRLAPDRVLFVSADVAPIDQGWSAAGYAVAGMTDSTIVCDVSGPRALELLQQGTSYDLTSTDERPNESCNILFAGLRVAIVSRDEGWRLHVERPYATALWSWFHTVMIRV